MAPRPGPGRRAARRPPGGSRGAAGAAATGRTAAAGRGRPLAAVRSAPAAVERAIARQLGPLALRRPGQQRAAAGYRAAAAAAAVAGPRRLALDSRPVQRDREPR